MDADSATAAAGAGAVAEAADEGVTARTRPPAPGRDSFGEAWLSMRSMAFFTITLVLDADVVLRTCRNGKHRNRSHHAIARRFSSGEDI